MAEADPLVAIIEAFRRAHPWMRDGLCNEYPDVNFYPEVGESLAPAKAVCRRCIVREECLEYALVEFEQYGVWGGTSRKERWALRRARGLPVHHMPSYEQVIPRGPRPGTKRPRDDAA